MEIISDSIHHDSMPCVVPPSASRTDICLAAKYINKFPLPLVAELGAQNDGSHCCGSYRFLRGSLSGHLGGWVRKEKWRKRGLMKNTWMAGQGLGRIHQLEMRPIPDWALFYSKSTTKSEIGRDRLVLKSGSP